MSDRISEDDEKIAVGIDMGARSCCVGIWHQGKVEILPNEHGNRRTPCFVSFTETEILVGEAAKDQLLVNPSNTVFDVRTLIGKRYSDAQVQEELKHWPFRVTAGPDDKPVITVMFRGQETQYKPEEVLAMVLTKMLTIAATFVGKPIKTAVISVPAHFEDSERYGMKAVAKIAGLEKLKYMVKEPVAATLAYMCIENVEVMRSREMRYLIFDFGARALDVCLIDFEENICDVLTQSSDPSLGGQSLDDRLLHHFAQQIEKKLQTDIFVDSEALYRLKSVCEELGRKLSCSSECSTEMVWKGSEIQLSITRDEFEDMSIDLVQSCIAQVEKCLSYARKYKMEVDRFILVGGSSRIPKLRSLLQDMFGKELNDEINPDEVVAHGATIQAARNLDLYAIPGDENLSGETYCLIGPDLMPFNLGAETADGDLSVLVRRNTYINNKITGTQSFSTLFDNQTSVVLHIYEGQCPSAKDNRLVATLELSGLVPAPKGTPQVQVAFSVQEDGLLTVVAEEKEAGVRTEMSFPAFSWSHSCLSRKLTIDQETQLLADGEEKRILRGLPEYWEREGTTSLNLLSGACIQAGPC
ncbi:hypothetical protein MPTK1_4g05820 [Marchantia polymorpha subsp. ruderalis]|uniref:Uncharacterized protein n=2 Tax=Marchantia polymorpha TaxID=3197 RepID=A0AAF6B6S3_MARPO|nr:hypothetical protein MARPO_0087s0009 [Marchantia polymorpha]BBN07707.1 hypothetical protein Mp_4g05820 [Marchantia polymorpha subsp. ruderalis]|eukprot:PTQ33566.1 hypothetical protein MARPO_0087s0009 [Marchantia polymorpha]